MTYDRTRRGGVTPGLRLVLGLAWLVLGWSVPVRAEEEFRPRSAPAPAGLVEDKSAIVAFETSPFPYEGLDPETGKPFFDTTKDGRPAHTTGATPTVQIYRDDQAYSDKRVLLYIPKGFDADRPALMIVYFHGNKETLERDIAGWQGIPKQLAQSGLNAVLVVPQLAHDAADSSAGRFWQPGVFADFLREAEGKLAALYGPNSPRNVFHTMPVVLMGFSGAFVPIAAILDVGHVQERIAGIVMLDAVYGEQKRLADWITRHRSTFFLSAYSGATLDETVELQLMLDARGIRFQTSLPYGIGPGSVTFLNVPDAKHVTFMVHAWVADPISAVLSRIDGYPRGATFVEDHDEGLYAPRSSDAAVPIPEVR